MVFGILISILNIVSVYYATKNDKMTWIIGLFPAIITTILFAIDGLWLSAIFNFYSFIICILGIIYWKNSAKENLEDVIGINNKSIMHMLYVLLGFTRRFGAAQVTIFTSYHSDSGISCGLAVSLLKTVTLGV